ncbi:unnamed protein product [[Candida] boidinii]|nr:unnamed protein product [[Candida] boidinii]
MNSMGFKPFDLGPFNSGAQIAAAAVNGLFQGSNNNGFSMSDFENNSKNNSGGDTVSSSPVSDHTSLAFGIENTSLSHTNSNNSSGVFNPLLNNGSNFDSLINAPSSLNRNNNGSLMNNNAIDLNGSSTGSFMDNVNGNNSFDDSKLSFNEDLHQ